MATPKRIQQIFSMQSFFWNTKSTTDTQRSQRLRVLPLSFVSVVLREKSWFAWVQLSLVFLSLFLLAYKNPLANKNEKKQPVSISTNYKSSSQDLEIIRQRIVDDLLEPPIEQKQVQNLITTIKSDGSWPGIDYKDTSRTGFRHSIHLENMLTLVRAYKKPGNAFYKNGSVKTALAAALDFWMAHDFICENWWWNEMGTPNWMINTLLLFDEELTNAERSTGLRIASRASLTGVGARAGGDFVPIAGMVVKQGLFKRNDSVVRNALDVMTAQIKLTTGRGVKPDLSFHHRVDNVISIHTYGTNYVSSFAYWAVKTEGTKYRLPDTAMKLLIDYYLDGICKASAFGIYPDLGAENRDLSRKGILHAAGTEIPQNLLQASSYRKGELEDIVRIRRGEKKPTAIWDKFFWYSEYFMHQRPNYYASVRMHSSRQNGVEEPYNEEGLKNHHLADGANYITRTGKEYVDIFPVWDWQKIPGTTVMQKPSLPHWKEIAKKGLSDFVGAASDGEFGVAAFDFKSPHDPLTARKAWFFFDKEYVCLGSGIACDGDYPVATTVNQCLLKGEVWVKTKSGLSKAASGHHAMADVDWILHDSVAYLFPKSAALNLFDSTATGNWRLITHQANASTEPVQKDVFLLWFNHGVHPQAGSYQYVVLPAVDAKSIEAYRKTQPIAVVANIPEIQAVHNRPLQLTQIVFYQAGTLPLTDGVLITAESPCLLMLKMNGKRVEKIAVSDPTHLLTNLRLKISVPLNASENGWKATWNEGAKASLIEVALPKGEEAGKSVTLNLSGKR